MDIINECTRVARKEHICDLCHGTINTGNKYFYQFIADGGETWSFKAHDYCEFLMRELWEYADPVDYFTDDDFNESVKSFCKEFICKDCPHYNTDYSNNCDKEEPYCISKVVDKLTTYYVYKDYNRQNPIFCKFYLKERENAAEKFTVPDDCDESPLLSWAENEVELACCTNKILDTDCQEFDYASACYRGALEAFKILCNQGHSGMSIQITKNALNRLIDGKCLTSIKDTDDIWTECWHKDDYVEYQCKRMSSLFKRVYTDGKVRYRDINKFAGTYEGSPCTYHSGHLDMIMEEIYPTTLPYIPQSKPYLIYSEDFLFDTKNGDYDTVAYLYCITPDGEKVEINKFFKESSSHDSKMVPISKFEYYVRKWISEKRLNVSDKNKTK